MAWSGPANRKQQDKKFNKAAEVAQAWLIRGFTPQQVAQAIHNKTGYTVEAENGVVKIYGCYNDEYDNWRGKRENRFYVMREITAESINIP